MPPPTADSQPVLVELFTSEGCSSCPPADDLLRSLNGFVTPGGHRIVALSEHVAYWNRLGWADPFSFQALSDRQEIYGDVLSLDEIYTPQAVVNGAAQIIGSDRSAVLAAVDAQTTPLPLRVDIRSVVVISEGIAVNYAVDGTSPPQGVEVHVALSEDEVTVQVPRGENAGRTLTHASVVRSMRHAPMPAAGEAANVVIPPVHPVRGLSTGDRHVVVFIQTAGQGRVLGMAVAPVIPPFPTTPFAVAAPAPYTGNSLAVPAPHPSGGASSLTSTQGNVREAR